MKVWSSTEQPWAQGKICVDAEALAMEMASRDSVQNSRNTELEEERGQMGKKALKGKGQREGPGTEQEFSGEAEGGGMGFCLAGIGHAP